MGLFYVIRINCQVQKQLFEIVLVWLGGLFSFVFMCSFFMRTHMVSVTFPGFDCKLFMASRSADRMSVSESGRGEVVSMVPFVVGSRWVREELWVESI